MSFSARFLSLSVGRSRSSSMQSFSRERVIPTAIKLPHNYYQINKAIVHTLHCTCNAMATRKRRNDKTAHVHLNRPFVHHSPPITGGADTPPLTVCISAGCSQNAYLEYADILLPSVAEGPLDIGLEGLAAVCNCSQADAPISKARPPTPMYMRTTCAFGHNIKLLQTDAVGRSNFHRSRLSAT